jgi:hypothetical protein
MLKIDRQAMRFHSLAAVKLSEAGHSERYHLQEYIANSPEAFFKEIGQQLFLVGKEITPSEVEKRRIDLLALDPSGRAVIIELKCGNDEKHLFQALSYAAMLSKWTPEDFLELLSPVQREGLSDFLESGSVEDLNSGQRIILIAEAFDYQVLVTAEWLSEMYGVDIACCRLSLSVDQLNEYLACSQILPAPELAQQALRRGAARAASATRTTRDWEVLLADFCRNDAVRSFFSERLSNNHHNRIARRDLVYADGGGRKSWYMQLQQSAANILQTGRFENDREFWRSRLDVDVVERTGGEQVTFKLDSKDKLDVFHRIMEQDVGHIRVRKTSLLSSEEDLD